LRATGHIVAITITFIVKLFFTITIIIVVVAVVNLILERLVGRSSRRATSGTLAAMSQIGIRLGILSSRATVKQQQLFS
jgi:hypothetical protein